MNTFEKLQSLAEWNEQPTTNLQNADLTDVQPIQPDEDANVTPVHPVQPGPMLADEDADLTDVQPIQPDEDANVTAVHPVQPGPMLADEDADLTDVQPIQPDEDANVTAVHPVQPGPMLASDEDSGGNDFSAMLTAMSDDGYYSDDIMARMEDFVANDMYTGPTIAASETSQETMDNAVVIDEVSEIAMIGPYGDTYDFTPDTTPLDSLGVDFIV